MRKPSESVRSRAQRTASEKYPLGYEGRRHLSRRRLVCNSFWLVRLANRRRCIGIHTRPLLQSSDPANSRWVFKATVFKSRTCRGFVGFGDANPSNVSSLVHGAEMRVAETRAVNRALRKAYGIGVCSVEEIGWAPRSD